MRAVAPAVRPFPIWRLRAVLIAILVALTSVYTWVLVRSASSTPGADVEAVREAAVTGAFLRIAAGTLLVLVLTHAIRVRDRRLAEYAAELERMVGERTRELELRGDGMRRVLDHVDQGLVTVGIDGRIDDERSACFDRWFGPVAAGSSVTELLAARAPSFALWFDLGLEALREGALPIEVVLAQLPRRFASAGRQFAVEYSPIVEGARVRRMLLVVSDVTARAVRDRAERGERELMAVFQRIAQDRAGLEQFLDETGELVGRLAVPGDPVDERRLLHTLKGDCRLEGLETFADLCHAIEDELAELRPARPLTAEQRERLRTGWRELCARLAQLLGDGGRQVVELDRRELSATIDKVRHGGSSRELAALLGSWLHEPVARRFERLGLHARQLARRLGKGEIELVLRDGGLRLDAARWTPFWRALLHAVANAVDHGLESPSERVAADKPARGLLALAARVSPRGLEVTLSDDGRGIDWDAVRAHAQHAGLPCATDDELEAALFRDGLTTRDEVTAISGRGVGLAALHQAVCALGGTITVTSTAGAGTTFTFRFPSGSEIVVPLRSPSQPFPPLREAG